MNLHEGMDREQMRMAILNQEHIFRQQVHELHRLYHVQKQLMQQALPPATPTPASRVLPAAVVAKPRPQQQQQQLDIWCGDKAANFQPQQQRIISFASYDDKATAAEAPVLAEECNLELTLATGPSSSSSNSSSCGAGSKRRKAAVAASKSDSGATAASSSSTSTDSELERFGEADVATMPVRFHGEVGRRMDGMGQGPWMYQCLSLKTA